MQQNSTEKEPQHSGKTHGGKKHRTLVWLTVALAFIVIGGMLTGIGYLSGGKLSGFSLVWQDGGLSAVSGSDETTVMQIADIPGMSGDILSAGEIISGLKINAGNASITVAPARPGETPVLRLRNLKGETEFSDGTLVIRAQDARRQGKDRAIRIFDVVDISIKEIDIRLPSGSLDSVALETSNGRIHIEDMDFTEGTLFTSNGVISMENTNFSKGSLSTSNGRISLSDTGWDTLDARTSNARVDISGARAGEGRTSIETSNGRVHLGLLGNEDDFSYTIFTSNGSIDVNGGRQRGARGDTLRGGTGAHQIWIQTSNSRVNLEFEKGF